MTEILGVIGVFLFTFANLPTLIKVMGEGRVEFIPKSTQWMLFFGSSFMYAYLLLKGDSSLLELLSYLLSSIIWVIVLLYEYFPREN